MFGSNTDRQWETLGATDPYFAVATHEENRRDRLTAGQKDAFFDSGEQHIREVFRNIELHLPADGGTRQATSEDPLETADAFDRDASVPGTVGVVPFRPRNGLDFGCGVGRLIVPLAGLAREVVGVDVADSMLAEAAANCHDRGLTNVRLIKGDDGLSSINEKFDFIHSCYVFQHIPPKRGYAIFHRLLDCLADNGVGVIHFKYRTQGALARVVAKLKNVIPLGHNLSNLVRGRAWNEPAMEMNNYDLNVLLSSIQLRGARDIYLTFETHVRHLSATLYFRMPAKDSHYEP